MDTTSKLERVSLKGMTKKFLHIGGSVYIVSQFMSFASGIHYINTKNITPEESYVMSAYYAKEADWFDNIIAAGFVIAQDFHARGHEDKSFIPKIRYYPPKSFT